LTAAAWALLAVAGAAAFGDWIAVAPGVRSRGAEYILKPAAVLALIAVAFSLHPRDGAQRVAFLVALVLSLAGDVFLMLPSDEFVAGLSAFLLAHLAYIAGFALTGLRGSWFVAGAAVVAVSGATFGRRIVRAVRERDRRLAVPVVAYMSAISVMVLLAIGEGNALALAGALLFYCSDALIAWDRFVERKTWARPVIMATYHLAQAGLVVSLKR